MFIPPKHLNNCARIIEFFAFVRVTPLTREGLPSASKVAHMVTQGHSLLRITTSHVVYAHGREPFIGASVLRLPHGMVVGCPLPLMDAIAPTTWLIKAMQFVNIHLPKGCGDGGKARIDSEPWNLVRAKEKTSQQVGSGLRRACPGSYEVLEDFA